MTFLPKVNKNFSRTAEKSLDVAKTHLKFPCFFPRVACLTHERAWKHTFNLTFVLLPDVETDQQQTKEKKVGRVLIWDAKS